MYIILILILVLILADVWLWADAVNEARVGGGRKSSRRCSRRISFFFASKRSKRSDIQIQFTMILQYALVVLVVELQCNCQLDRSSHAHNWTARAFLCIQSTSRIVCSLTWPSLRTNGASASKAVSLTGDKASITPSNVYRLGSGDHIIEFCRRLHLAFGAGRVAPPASGGGGLVCSESHTMPSKKPCARSAASPPLKNKTQ